MKKPKNIALWVLLFPVFMLIIIAVLLAVETYPEEPEYSILDKKSQMTKANELKRKGFTTNVNSQRTRVCAERPVSGPHARHEFHMHFESYCLDEGGWVPFKENWPHPDSLQQVHVDMIKAVDSLALRYGF